MTPPALGRLAFLAAATLLASAALAQAVPPPPPTVGGPAAAAAPAPECAALPAPDLDVPTALRRLVDCSRELRVAVLAADAARADIVTASQRPNPTLSVGAGGVNFVNGLGAGGLLDKQVDLTARLDQPLERGNKRGLRMEAAEQAWRAARWNAADTLRQQQFALAQAWIDLWGAQQRLRLQDELLGLFARTRDAAQRRLKAGDIAANDVTRIDLDVQRAENERLVAVADLVRARNVMARLLSMEPVAPRLVAIAPWPSRPADLLREAAVPVDAERPDLLAARAQLSAADAQSRLARSLQTRDVNIGVQVERYAPPAGDGWLGGVYFSVPLFVQHRFEGEIARAEADRATARAVLDRVERQALADRQRLLDDWSGARNRRERIERDALPLAERVAANADLAYRKGAATVLELLDALRALRALQLEALAARLEQDRADAAVRAEMLTPSAATDPVFGESLSRLRPDTP
jgi:cobalt-zinc-cadmium efflux system outer membrane protein